MTENQKADQKDCPLSGEGWTGKQLKGTFQTFLDPERGLVLGGCTMGVYNSQNFSHCTLLRAIHLEVKVNVSSHLRLFASQSPWSIQFMEFSRPEYWSGQPFPSPGNRPNLGIKSSSPALQADSLPAEPQGKPRNTGVGSLYILQQIFPIQESNWGLQYCRRILYQLN